MCFQRLVGDSDIDSNSLCLVRNTVGENRTLITNEIVSLLENPDMTPLLVCLHVHFCHCCLPRKCSCVYLFVNLMRTIQMNIVT